MVHEAQVRVASLNGSISKCGGQMLELKKMSREIPRRKDCKYSMVTWDAAGTGGITDSGGWGGAEDRSRSGVPHRLGDALDQPRKESKSVFEPAWLNALDKIVLFHPVGPLCETLPPREATVPHNMPQKLESPTRAHWNRQIPAYEEGEQERHLL